MDIDIATGRGKLLDFVEWALDSHLTIDDISYHVDRRTLIRSLERNGYNQSIVARELNTHRNTVARKIAEYKIALPPINQRFRRPTKKCPSPVALAAFRD